MRKAFFLAGIFAMLALGSAFACTNFMAGKAATADGSTLISYAADSYSFYGYLHYRAAADHPAGSMRKVICWDDGKPLMEIPEIPHTYTVVGNTNEHQVTIGETTWGGRNMADTVGIDYGSLIYIALERSKTAREAIHWITSLASEYGYVSGGESFSIGDPNEVWIMEMTGKGKGRKGVVWAAARIPDDCISGHANQARITYLPVKGAKKKGDIYTSKDGQWMWHKDVIQVARDSSFFSGTDEEFQFNHAYNPFDFTGLYVCEARVWSVFRKFADDMDRYLGYAAGKVYLATDGREAGEPMPLWVKPNHKITVQEFKDAMRDQFEGTELDITKGIDAGPYHSKLRYGGLGFKQDSTQYWFERPVATQQTAWSYVSQMRGYESAKAGGIFWFGLDDAATNLYVPLYNTINQAPDCMREGNGDLYTYSPTSAWWAYNRVANWAYPRYSLMLPDIKKVQKTWEDKFNSQVEAIDKAVADMTEAERREFLTNYSCRQADESTAAWNELFTYLTVKFIDGNVRKEENGQFKRNEWGEPVGPQRVGYPTEFQNLFKHQLYHEKAQ